MAMATPCHIGSSATVRRGGRLIFLLWRVAAAAACGFGLGALIHEFSFFDFLFD